MYKISITADEPHLIQVEESKPKHGLVRKCNQHPILSEWIGRSPVL